MWSDPALDDEHIGWARDTAAAMEPGVRRRVRELHAGRRAARAGAGRPSRRGVRTPAHAEDPPDLSNVLRRNQNIPPLYFTSSGSTGMTTPGSRPRSTACVTADPNRSRTSSSAASIALRNRDPNESASWSRSSSSRFVSAIPTMRGPAPRSSGSTRRGALERRRGSCSSARSPGRAVCDRVARVKSAKRRRSTTVRQTRSPFRSRRGDAVDEPDDDRVDLGERSGRPAERAGSRSSRAGSPVRTTRGSRLWASAWRCPPDARPRR